MSNATGAGAVLQLAMVLVGHSNPAVARWFAVGGMGISLVAGVIYARLAGKTSTLSAVIGGAAVGGGCAFIGIVFSYFFGDVPALILVVGTLSSAMTGALGGWLGNRTTGQQRSTA